MASRGHRSCGSVAATVFWTAVTLLLDSMPVAMLQAGAGVPTALFIVLFLLPFNVIMVAMWASIAVDARDDRSPAGAGRVQRTPNGWVVRLPDRGGRFYAVLALILLPVLGVFALLLGLQIFPPPATGTVAVAAVAGSIAAWAYRRWGFRPTVVIDDKARTVTFRSERDRAGRTVSWSAVTRVEVIERWTRDPEENIEYVSGYELRVHLGGKGGTRAVDLTGRTRREPVERLATWLRERLKPTGNAGS